MATPRGSETWEICVAFAEGRQASVLGPWVLLVLLVGLSFGRAHLGNSPGPGDARQRAAPPESPVCVPHLPSPGDLGDLGCPRACRERWS